MEKEELFNLIENIDEKYINLSNSYYPKKKKIKPVKVLIVLAILIGIQFILIIKK